MLVSTRTWAALGLVALLAAACGGADEPAPASQESAPADEPAPAAEDPGLAFTPPQEGDCEEGKKNLVPAARKLMDAQVPSGGEAFFEGSAEACGIDEIEMKVSGVGKGQGKPKAFFSPSVLVGEPGQQLTLSLWAPETTNTHNFSLDEQGIDEVIVAGDSLKVQVTFPTNGKPLLFYCRFHDVGGQWGALVTY